MKTLLVIAQHPALSEAIASALSAEKYRVIHRVTADAAEPLLTPQLVDACILEGESEVHSLWSIEKVRRRLPHCPLFVFVEASPWEWEEDAYLQGVSVILTKPVRPRLLNGLLERMSSSPLPPRPDYKTPPPPPASKTGATISEESHQACHALEILRDFSAILTHSLRAEAMLKQFLLMLREIIGVNRAAIFLGQPPNLFQGLPSPDDTRRLRSACAIGLSPGLLEHFQLSFESGIGGFLYRQGRILRRESVDAQASEMQKEFELLGAQVAVPMLDRETLIGVAVFDGRLTGEPLANCELELIFHLLEELGLAVRNVWLHDQLVGNNEMMADILRQLSSACVVVSRDLNVMHANKAARQFFARPGRRGADLEFSDLPQLIGSKIYQALKTGSSIAPFKFQPADAAQSVYQISIVPIQEENAALPDSVLLVAEDRTQSEQLQRLEIEAANLRLIRSMADRMAHEIGNALVPLSTHQQLLSERHRDPEFRASLENALIDSVRRITRLTTQMRFLSRETVASREQIPLSKLIDEAFQEAQKYQPAKTTKLRFDSGLPPIQIAGDHVALKHALAEVIINALQANPADPTVVVRAQTQTNGRNEDSVEIEVQDNGPGFSKDAVQQAPEPFFTTRNVGLGLGLTVTRKIIETHQGKLTVVEAGPNRHGVVRITLPSEAPR